MTARPRLRALARRLGVEDGYRSAIDERWIATSDATREALVEAMGFAASSESLAEASLARLDDQPHRAAPDRACAADVDTVLGGGRAFGIWTNLYSVRSRSNLGFGNFADLDWLVRRAGQEGAAFVGTNPLHAATHRAGRFCPYTPVSRLFRDPLYLDPVRVPELATSAAARRLRSSQGWCARIEQLRDAARLDAEAVEAAQAELLEPLHASFAAGSGAQADARRRAFSEFRAAAGSDLRDFTTFLALADHFEGEGRGRSWPAWPEPFRRPDSAPVREFAAAHAAAIDRHAFTQFEIERQLGEVAQAAREAGLAIGLYTDLALGSDGGGSDVWSRPHLFARGVSAGAPPDAFAPDGQDWCFPPLDPHALARERFAFWNALLDANLCHAGALRIDHALGLRRLFWIPAGRPAHDGAYVRYPEAELLAVLAAASRSRGALLIAEDLGTVPPGFSEAIQRRGLLSSRVLLFERSKRGFRSRTRYPRACLATANTHDLPPLAALEGDGDLRLRRRAGQIQSDAALEAAREERRRDRAALRTRLVRDGFLARDVSDPAAWAAGVTAFLCDSPAALVGIALDDLAAETEPINLPGVAADRHPSWTRRMGRPLDAIFDAPHARAQLEAIPSARRAPKSRPGGARS
jgi:4-alpha-glucanotransferase